jgi:hypothetical protein
MGLISSIFGGKGKNPADAAMPYLNQIGPMAQQNLGPYQQQGQTAQQQNAGQYQSMVENPADFYAKLRSSYTPSAGYKYRQDKYQKAMEGAAAAGGFRGTTSDQAAQAALVQGLLGEDEGAYLDRLTGILGTGLQGNENIANRGYGAATDLTNIQGSTLANQGQLAFKGQENQNASNQGFQKMLMQLLGGGAGALLGGPMGAITGANVAGGNIPYPASTNGGQPSNSQQYASNLFGGRR